MDRIEVRQGGILDLQADAVVYFSTEGTHLSQTAESSIFSEAGDELLEACQRQGSSKPGDAYITGAYGLSERVKWIIHAVAPAWAGGGSEEEEQLRSCWIRSLELAVSHQAETVAVLCGSVKSTGCPDGRAEVLLLKEVSGLTEADNEMGKITFLCEDPDIYAFCSEFVSLMKVVEDKRNNGSKDSTASASNDLGNFCYKHALYDNAVSEYREAVRLQPKKVAFWYNLTWGYYRTQKYDMAIEALQEVKEKGVQEGRYWNLLGICLREKKDYKEAIAAGTHATQLNPENPSYWVSLGNTQHAKGDYEAAIAAKAAAIDLESANPNYWNSLGNSQHAKGDYEAAVASKKAAIQLDGENADYWSSLGNTFRDKGDINEEIKARRKAVDLKPEVSDNYNRLGIAYIRQQDYPNARKALEEAIERSPQKSYCYYNMSVSYYFDDQLDQALVYAEQAVRINRNIKGGSSTHYNLLGWLTYLRYGDAEQAESLFVEGKEWAKREDKSAASFLRTIIRRMRSNNHGDYRIIHCFASVYSELLKETQFYFISKIIEDFKDQNDIQLRLLTMQIRLRNIMNACAFDVSKGQHLAHYSRMSVLPKIMKKQEEDESQTVKLRLNNAAYMNDPSEGLMLIDALIQCHEEGSPLLNEVRDNFHSSADADMQSSNVYLHSLTMQIDQLPMWAQYGDQGKGYCLVMRSDFFDSDYDVLEHDFKSQWESTDRFSKKYIPYRVAYIHNDCKDGIKLKFGKDEEKQPRAELDELEKNEQIVAEELQEIVSEFSFFSSQCEMDGTYKTLRNKILFHLTEAIDQIRFLFKTEDYAYEQELRLIRYAPADSPDIKLNMEASPVPELYLEKDDGKPFRAFKIILGPKVEQPGKIVPYLKYVDREMSVEKSKVKFR